jgi:hypothetical protein
MPHLNKMDDGDGEGLPALPPDDGGGAARDPVVDDAVPAATTSSSSKNGSGAPSRRGSVAAQPNDADDMEDDTGLLWFAGDGDAEEVKGIIDDYEVDDLPLEAALLVACQNGHIHVVKVLLSGKTNTALTVAVSAANWFYDGKNINILNITGLTNGSTYSISLEVM